MDAEFAGSGEWQRARLTGRADPSDADALWAMTDPTAHGPAAATPHSPSRTPVFMSPTPEPPVPSQPDSSADPHWGGLDIVAQWTVPEPSISEPPSGRRAAPERLSAPPLPNRTPHETVIPAPEPSRFTEVPRPLSAEAAAAQRPVMSDVSRPTVSEVPRALPGDSAYGLLAEAGAYGTVQPAFPEPAVSEVTAAPAESPLTRFTEPPRVSEPVRPGLTAFPEPVRALTESPVVAWTEEPAATWTPRPLSGLTSGEGAPVVVSEAEPAGRFATSGLPRPALSGPIEPDVSSTSVTDSNLPVYREPVRGEAADVALPVRDSSARLPRAARGADTPVPRLSSPVTPAPEPAQPTRLTETGWTEAGNSVRPLVFTEPAGDPYGTLPGSGGGALSSVAGLPGAHTAPGSYADSLPGIGALPGSVAGAQANSAGGALPGAGSGPLAGSAGGSATGALPGLDGGSHSGSAASLSGGISGAQSNTASGSPLAGAVPGIDGGSLPGGTLSGSATGARPGVGGGSHASSAAGSIPSTTIDAQQNSTASRPGTGDSPLAGSVGSPASGSLPGIKGSSLSGGTVGTQAHSDVLSSGTVGTQANSAGLSSVTGDALAGSGSLPGSTGSTLPRPERGLPSAEASILASELAETPVQPIGTAVPQPISGSPTKANGSSLPSSTGGTLSGATGSTPPRGAHSDSSRVAAAETPGRPIIRRHQSSTGSSRLAEPEPAPVAEATPGKAAEPESAEPPVVAETPRAESSGGRRHATGTRPAFAAAVPITPEPSYQTTVPAMPVVTDETADPASVDMRLVMRLMVASNALIAAADAAPVSDPDVARVVQAAHQAHAAAVDVVSAWFGGRGQMREFAAALLAATE